jgi:hypothetical protein
MIRTIGDWFAKNWLHAGVVAGLFLLALVPVLADAWTLPILLVYLQLPIYMLHQLEEHAGDRFRKFANAQLAGGRDALTTAAVIVINVPLVWGVDLASLYLARFVEPGLGLIAVYLTVVNGIVHIVAALVGRLYNPGLATAAALFIPVGLWALVVLAGTPGVTILDHAIGLVAALIVHAAIIAWVMRRARLLAAA